MGCEKPQIAPGILSSSRCMAAMSSSFVFVEDRAPLVFRFQIDEKFGVEEAGRVGAVVGAADLAGAPGTSGKEHRMIRAWLATRMPSSGPVDSERACRAPKGAFIEMGQELGADHAAEEQQRLPTQNQPGHADGYVAMPDRPAPAFR
jgi:hypothetical protein